MGVIKLAYFREGRILRKCKVIFGEGKVKVKLYPDIHYMVVKLRGQLSIRELQTILGSRGTDLLEFMVSDVKSVVKYGVRRTRRGLRELFPEDVKGNLSEVLIKLPNATLCLLMMEKDAVKILKYLSSGKK